MMKNAIRSITATFTVPNDVPDEEMLAVIAAIRERLQQAGIDDVVVDSFEAEDRETAIDELGVFDIDPTKLPAVPHDVIESIREDWRRAGWEIEVTSAEGNDVYFKILRAGAPANPLDPAPPGN